MREKHIAVLGCSGFIGSHILHYLLKNTDYFITGIDIHHARIDNLKDHPRLSFVASDIYSEQELLRDTISRCSIVISLAALCNPSLYITTPVEVIESNYIKPYQILQLCAQYGSWLIHFSTCEVYGKSKEALLKNASCGSGGVPDIFIEDHTQMIVGPVQAQRWCYAVAKQLYERTLYAWGIQKGLNYTIIRPFNFIGPRMDYIPGVDGEGVPRVMACFMKALLSGTPLKLVDGGLSRRCFTYIDDAVEAVAAILRNPDDSKNQIFNIGNPANEIMIQELAHLMITIYSELAADKSTMAGTVEEVSSREFYGEGYEDSDRRIPNIDKAMKLLNWHPKVNLETALRMTIQSYIYQYGQIGSI
ncbi:MAG TPA: bifunctional UDP-4-keto-pentose/UDP-xylose synthase [Chitinispirillaceae bacterium]|nr:bifunctional UDP-4-keto-pentose/UDP-xylose synthase [Chitinispirillaceae bacterium]